MGVALKPICARIEQAPLKNGCPDSFCGLEKPGVLEGAPAVLCGAGRSGPEIGYALGLRQQRSKLVLGAYYPLEFLSGILRLVVKPTDGHPRNRRYRTGHRCDADLCLAIAKLLYGYVNELSH